MRFNTKERYSLLMLTELAGRYGDDSFVKLKDIASSIERPEKYLAQLVAPLSSAGIIKTCPGPRGGLKLSCDPEDIRVNQVLESISGKLDLSGCINTPESCNDSRACRLRHVFKDINSSLLNVLGSYTLDDLKNGKDPAG